MSIHRNPWFCTTGYGGCPACEREQELAERDLGIFDSVEDWESFLAVYA